MRSYSERRPPKRQSGRHVHVAVSPLTVAVTLLEYIISHPINRPYLSVMCMSAELQVDAGRFCFFQLEGLMIQQDDRFVFIDIRHKFLQGTAFAVVMVIAAYQLYAVGECHY